LNVIAWITAIYGGVAGIVWAVQRSIIFPAPRAHIEPSLPGAALVRIPGSGGRVVHALHVPAPPGSATIVHFHGNGESLADQSHLGASFKARGIGFFAVEYPGYGLSSDTGPSEAAIYEDAEAALVNLRDVLGVAQKDTVLEGQSLGTGVAIEMAARGYGAKVVLISPYTSIPDIARLMLRFLAVNFLVRDRFDSASKVGSLSLPALVAHGTDDEVIPFAMGERIAKLYPGARLEILKGAHHNDVWQFPSLMNAIVAFVQEK
jgi:pimeloyl-ACP methyl ester carboxylesterase